MQNGSSQSEEEGSSPVETGRAVIGLFPTSKKAHEAGLAVLAAGSHYWVFPLENKYALVVDEAQAVTLKNEVRIYGLRNRFWPRISPALAEKNISAIPTFAFGGALVLIYYLQGLFPNLEDWGMNSSTDCWENGAWWRIVTAVSLHADLAHLVGNLSGLTLFGYFAARYLGNGLGWMGILLTSSLANLTNNFLHMGSPFYSLGASTAVFGALGLVTGFPIGSYLRTGIRLTSREWLIPLSGGIMLLAWMGSGSFPTDVAGHLWSFILGVLLSVVLAKYQVHAKVTKGVQRFLLGLCWSLLAASWTLAVRQSG